MAGIVVAGLVREKWDAKEKPQKCHRICEVFVGVGRRERNGASGSRARKRGRGGHGARSLEGGAWRQSSVARAALRMASIVGLERLSALASAPMMLPSLNVGHLARGTCNSANSVSRRDVSPVASLVLRALRSSQS